MSQKARRTRYPKPALELILEALRRKGAALTAKEIAELTGVKFNTVRGRLQDLKKKGLVRKIGRKWMAVR